MRLLASSLVGAALVCVSASARAQECGCDHELGLDVTTADGEALGVEPGDVVCVAAGDREFLRLSRFVGSEAAPIVVKNCGGRVVIRNTERAYALVVEGQSRYLHITGTGDPAVEHGFDVSAPGLEPYAGVGVWIQGRASDVEVDHVEVHHTGFAGVMAKTDPGCEDRAAWDGFVMRNVHLHHLWVHDTGGEGFYVGSTQGAGYARTCDGEMVTIPAHFMEGVEIDHVRIEDTGWDGAQIGFARSDCSFHDNVVRRVGLANEMYQTQALQIGSWSSCEVRRNVLSDGPAMGVIVLDSGDTTIADNVIARFGVNGVYANLRGDTYESARYRVVHNTIVDAVEGAVRVFGAGVVESGAWNNFVVGARGEGEISAGADVGWESDHNVVVATGDEARFRGADDYHLGDGSPARGAGRDLIAMGFALDLEGRARANPPSVGAYEHTEDAPDAGPAIDGGRRPADAGAPGSGGDGGGCSCRVGQRAGSGWGAALVLGAMLALRARRRRG